MPTLIRLGIVQALAALLLFLLLPGSLRAWQQRVHYTMDIEMDVEAHSYDGTQRLVYYNNSPDTIRHVYYHLFYRAFKPGSMMDVRDHDINNGALRINELNADHQGSVDVSSLKQDGGDVTWTIDETVLRAELREPILPGDSTVLEMRWRTQIPLLSRRGGWMSREGIEFSMSQWYPKLAEYDRSGWHPDEYVSREFYGVFGTFDVSITIPSRYVLGGTGVVTNANEVKCGYELGPVDTLIIAPASGSGMKTWRFHAENVHDFAWVADPDYVHGITSWNGVTIHVLVIRSLARVWQHAGAYTSAAMAYFSKRFGMYAWPQFTVAMAGDGGMEYPMLIMITGNRTQASLAGVIAHELGHQWYYGMIGNNETEEAWMDEGFTQYLTNEANHKVYRTQGGENPYQGLDRVVYPWVTGRWMNLDNVYELGIQGYDEPLNTFHDRFRENTTSGLVYWKGEAVMLMLQYMFGDSLFDAAMRHYYSTWRFRHPNARDFEHAMEEASGMRLDWFFNEWIGSTKKCDYALDDLESEPATDGYTTTLELSNRNEIIMPLDVTLTYDDGSTATANIPVEEWRKPGVDFHLPRWKWVARSYRTSFATPRRVVKATIDTTLLLLDIDRTNNTKRIGFLADLLPPTSTAWYRRWDIQRPIDRYTIRLRPTLWYSQADGPQLGILADGGYAYNRYNARLGGAYNIRSKRVDYNIGYNTSIDLLGRLGRIDLFATNSDGVQRWGASVEKTVRATTGSTPQKIALRTEREVLVGGNYPNAVAPWSSGGYNTIGLGYSVSGMLGRLLYLGGAADFDASFASRSEFTQWKIAGEMRWNVGTFVVGGNLFLGASLGDPPAHRLFNAAGATSREMHLNAIHRLAMNSHPEFMARNHLVLPTQGYLLSLAPLDSAARLGRNLLNARVTFGDLNPFSRIFSIPFLRQIEMKLYAAGGWLFREDFTWRGFSDFNVEAGAAAELDLINAFLPSTVAAGLDSPAPIKLSFHLPFFASSKLLEKEGLGYRWAIGVSM